MQKNHKPVNTGLVRDVLEDTEAIEICCSEVNGEVTNKVHGLAVIRMLIDWILMYIEVIQYTVDDIETAVAVVDGIVDDILEDTIDIHDAVSHVSSIFPADTNLTCTFTAHADEHTWSAWTEIVDSAATKLSAATAATPGHITSILVETVSDNTVLYMYEVAWGAAKVLITSGRFAGSGKFQAAHIQDRFWASNFPAGELIYYRLKSDKDASEDFCTVHFRYHIH